MEKMSYSFHIGNDKNKSKRSRKNIKTNKVVDQVFNNNAVQNANALSRVNNHNLRKYKDDTDKIEIIIGTNDLVDDVKKLYVDEFEKARLEYNDKQKRDDRKIKDYFEHISNNEKSDLAVEIIIELGDMTYWENKDISFKTKMTEVYQKQIIDLEKVVPEFKVANAVVHYDESSPHLHIIGVAIKTSNKNGMKKQVGKSAIFTKESLRTIQDTMRIYCIDAFNKTYNFNNELKTKLKGRNEDFETRHMNTYNKLKEESEINRKFLDDINNKTEKTIKKTENIQKIINELKPTKLNKDNYLINLEQIKKIEEYATTVNENVNKIKESGNITYVIENFENFLDNNEDKIKEYENTIYSQDHRINYLEKQVIKKQDTIANQRKDIKELEDEIGFLNSTIEYLKKLWHKLLDLLYSKFRSDKNEDAIYSEVINNLIENDILNNEDIDYIVDHKKDKDNNFEL